MESAIIAIGTATPQFKSHQKNTAELVAAGLNLNPKEKRLLKSIYKATGIEYRHSVLRDYVKMPGDFSFFPNDPEDDFPPTSARMNLYKANALPLAVRAIINCFEQVDNFDPKTITHLITVSCTGMYAPGLDVEIIQYLQLPSNIKRTGINFMGCYGVFNALKVADSFCRANPDAQVLIVSVELCTIHFQQNTSMDSIVSNAIFADGAAAAIVSSKPVDKHLTLNSFHCDIIPQTSQEMTWHIADSGFDIALSSYVPEIIQAGIANFIDKLLAQLDLLFSHIDMFAIHPGGLKILEACESALNIDKEQNNFSYEILRNYGNMSSATILFVLKSILDEIDEADQNKNIFSCAFGPGLTLESMLLRVNT